MIQPNQTKIGLPRALLYHKYAPLWSRFFQSLGCQVISSPNTNRSILEQGLRYSIDENCLAVKIFLGHVHYLIGKADYIFIPRIQSLYKDETLCVKLSALADIVRNTFDDVKILEYNVDVEKHQDEMRGIIDLGWQLTGSLSTAKAAYHEAVHELAHYKQVQLEKHKQSLQKHSDASCRVLLVAHSYITHDALLGKTIVRILEGLGAQIVYADLLEEETARQLSSKLSTDCYWTYNKELLGGIEFYKEQVDGIIFLMAFPCGPDALIVTLCQHMLQDIPLCVLNMDELQSDAGLKTRLESFLDILQFRMEKRL